MASETQVMETSMTPQKRKCRQSKGTKGKKRAKVLPSTERKVKIDKRMKQLFRKRARNYNSDDDDEDNEEGGEIAKEGGSANERYFRREEVSYGNSSGEEEENGPENEEESEASEDDDGPEIQPGITKFAEGCRAFKMAFVKITKKNLVEEGVLGPVLSGHKKLVVEKLAEELAERKGKGEAKKEKFLVGEKGHVKPANFLDLHEKFLISVATKGVVKLFNAVNKAQNAQKGLNPSRFKDAKELEKRRKRAFLSELRKKPSQTADSTAKDDGGPSWAPLRESYMLTNSKLKNWDKMQDTTTAYDEDEAMPHNSSSDED